jgi:sarcosine oxidase subunit beta
LTGNMANAADVVPALGQVRAVRSWTAWVNGTPDWRPILGEVPGVGLLSGAFSLGGFQRRAHDRQVTADMIVLGQSRPHA